MGNKITQESLNDKNNIVSLIYNKTYLQSKTINNSMLYKFINNNILLNNLSNIVPTCDCEKDMILKETAIIKKDCQYDIIICDECNKEIHDNICYHCEHKNKNGKVDEEFTNSTDFCLDCIYRLTIN